MKITAPRRAVAIFEEKYVTEIYVSQLTRYLAATTAKDADRAGRQAVVGIRDQLTSDYQHWKDHWKPVKDALLRDRRGSRDGQELADIIDRAAPQRRPSYTTAAQRWAQLAPWWDGLQHERLRKRSVKIGDLTVNVPRLCAERHPDGHLEALYVRFNQDRLPLHVTHGVTRIVQLAHPDTHVTFVDVHGLTTFSSLERDLTVYDHWLIQAGTDLSNELVDGQGKTQAA